MGPSELNNDAEKLFDVNNEPFYNESFDSEPFDSESFDSFDFKLFDSFDFEPFEQFELPHCLPTLYLYHRKTHFWVYNHMKKQSASLTPSIKFLI